MVNTCSVYGCMSTRHEKERRFYRFPKDKARCRKWLIACNRLDLLMNGEERINKSFGICDLHFEECYRIGIRLRYNALPTLKLTEDEIVFVDKSIQTDELEDYETDETCDAATDLNSSNDTETMTFKSEVLERGIIKKELVSNSDDTNFNTSNATQTVTFIKKEVLDIDFTAEEMSLTCDDTNLNAPNATETITFVETENHENNFTRKSLPSDATCSSNSSHTITIKTEELENAFTEELSLLRDVTSIGTLNTIETKTIKNENATKVEPSSSTPDKRKLMLDDKDDFKKRKNVDGDPDNVATITKSQEESHMMLKLHNVIDVQRKLHVYSRGNRYTKEFKLFALRAFFAGPTAYRVLSKIIRLPSERALRGINMNTGCNFFTNVITCLEAKLKHLTETGKYCVICAEEIPLKSHLFYQINSDKVVGLHEMDGMQTTEPATHAFVIMARGIFQNWEQPLIYFFLAPTKNYDELNTWLNSVISEIIRIGFKVVAFVSNQDTTFFNIASSRYITPDNPYFFIDNHRIYYIFDVPYLINSLRNCLLKCDIEYQTNNDTNAVASWSDIQTFYDQDKERSFRLAPKLTESHINPNNDEKKMVKYAAQVFSKTVAAGMNATNNDSIGTVKFIELINNTFDIFNSSKESDAKHSGRLPYQVETVNQFLLRSFAGLPYQMKTLDQFLNLLNTCHVKIDNSEYLEDVNIFERIRKGFMISVKSINSLWEDFKSENKYLFTRRLNLEALGKFFDSVRRQSGNRRAVTPVQFSRAFQKIFMENLLKHTKNAHCKEDIDYLLCNIDDIDVHIANHGEIFKRDDDTMICVNRTDYNFDVPEEIAFHYVCGYLLEACHEIHKCEGINAYVKLSKKIKLEEYVDDQDNSVCEMLIPPNSLSVFVRKLDHCLLNVFNEKELMGCLGREILEKQSNITFDDCCPCFPIEYLKKLFVRFRIYNVLTYNNRLLKSNSFEDRYIRVPNL